MKKIVALVFSTPFLCMDGYSQKQTEHVEQTWLAYFNQTRLSDKWGLWADFHLRTKEDFFSGLSTGIARIGVTYYANEKIRLTAGYAYVNSFPAAGHSEISQPEHRPWQQVQWQSNLPKAKWSQFLRLEERFRRKIQNDNELASGYNFNYRIRYGVSLLLPLSHNNFAPKTFSFALGNEVHVNMGKQIVNNYFDQDRFFVGLAYHVQTNMNVQFGYMNVFQQLPAGNRYKNVQGPRIYYYHQIDLRKKKNT